MNIFFKFTKLLHKGPGTNQESTHQQGYLPTSQESPQEKGHLPSS